MHPQPVSSVPYSYSPTVLQSGSIEVVDTNTIPPTSEQFLQVEAGLTSQDQLVYAHPTTPGLEPLHSQFTAECAGSTVLFSQEPSLGLNEATPQNDMDMEPIDLEEVQKIQARMPAADPNAPVGSSKNPIRIIQQGNQYITTQDVSDEHLQQIIQVLTNQALISSSSSRPNAIYNRLTNRRIIFRVTKAKRRHEDNTNRASYTSDRTKSTTGHRGRPPGRGGGRKRRKRDSDEEDPDFEPEVPEEEILPFPLARRTSTSGRISKPPKHLIKDYKHLKLEDLTTKPEYSEDDDHSDGGYSDYVQDGASDGGWSDDGEKTDNRHPCNLCGRVFGSRAGVARHKSAVHGSSDGRGRGRIVNPYVASMKRRAKLKEALAEATDDDLIEFVAPRLSKLISPWDHLLLRSEDGNPPLPQVPRVFLDYLSLAERVRSFLNDHLQPRAQKPSTPLPNDVSDSGVDSAVKIGTTQPPDTEPTGEPTTASTDSKATGEATGDNEMADTNGLLGGECATQPSEQESSDQVDDGSIIVKVITEEQSSILGLACGNYTVTSPLKEEYLPRRFRSILAAQQVASMNAEQNCDTNPIVSIETAVDDEVDATLRSDHVTNGNEKPTATADQAQSVVSLGNDLLLIPEGGLGGPVPEEWVTSGAFLTVLTENGDISDLVLEAATGRLFHRPTGHLVSLAEGADADAAPETVLDSNLPDYGAYEDEQPANKNAKLPEPVPPTRPPATKASARKRTGKQSLTTPPPTEQTSTADPDARHREQLLQKIAESGEMLDLNAIFPGVSVTEVSPGVCLVIKPNGDRFNVEHGGEGITLETLQTILQMDP